MVTLRMSTGRAFPDIMSIGAYNAARSGNLTSIRTRGVSIDVLKLRRVSEFRNEPSHLPSEMIVGVEEVSAEASETQGPSEEEYSHLVLLHDNLHILVRCRRKRSQIIRATLHRGKTRKNSNSPSYVAETRRGILSTFVPSTIWNMDPEE